MNETSTIYKLRKELNAAAFELTALYDLVEMLSNTACAWAWDRGAGVPELTDEEVQKILNEL